VNRVRIVVCASCPAGRDGLAARIAEAARGAAEVAEADCMSGCARPSSVAFRAAGKTAYLFGDVTVADIPDLMVFLQLYQRSHDGNLDDARPIGTLRQKALARIPG
jgi:predicted metal-binding protein